MGGTDGRQTGRVGRLYACFLKQVDNVVSLGAAEEAELTLRIETGRHASRVLAQIAERGEVLPDGHRSELMRTCRDGEDARDDLLKAHLDLVVSIARRCAGRGTAFLDLVQIGGLIGSGLQFEERGTHELKGVPGSDQLGLDGPPDEAQAVIE